MGRQITFYALPADLTRLERAIRDIGAMRVLHRRSPNSRPRALDSLDLKEDGKSWLFYSLCRTDDVESVMMNYVQAQGYWSIDTEKSPVIEFTRSYFDQTILRRGRVWYTTGYYGAFNDWVNKDEGFTRWARAVFRNVRMCLSKRNGDYIGSAAEDWVKAGGKLVET